MNRAMTYASALAIAAGLTAAPAMAQSQDQTQDQENVKAESQDESQAASQDQSSTETQPGQTAQAGDEQADQLIATVGAGEIRQSDVVATIETLPVGVRQTPPQMLLPAVVDQLIMRHLIVDKAKAEGLETDAEVAGLVDAGTDEAMEQALVEVWLKREIGERVTDETVQTAVDELKAQNPDMGDATPGLSQQVRQALQVQAMTDISDELRADAEITFYGPDGKPVEETGQVGSGSEGESQPETQSQN